MAVKPIPDGYPRVSPYLVVDGAQKAIEFYTTVLGATERMRMPGPDGRIGHAELEVGDSLIMLADEFPDMGAKAPAAYGGSPVSISVYVEDVDATFAKATEAGATVAGEPVLWRPIGDVRRPVRPPLDHRDTRRGRLPRGDEPPHGRDEPGSGPELARGAREHGSRVGSPPWRRSPAQDPGADGAEPGDSAWLSPWDASARWASVSPPRASATCTASTSGCHGSS